MKALTAEQMQALSAIVAGAIAATCKTDAPRFVLLVVQEDGEDWTADVVANVQHRPILEVMAKVLR